MLLTQKQFSVHSRGVCVSVSCRHFSSLSAHDVPLKLICHFFAVQMLLFNSHIYETHVAVILMTYPLGIMGAMRTKNINTNKIHTLYIYTRHVMQFLHAKYIHDG